MQNQLSTPLVHLMYDNSSQVLLRHALAQNSTPEQFKPIVEIIFNLYYGNIPVPTSDIIKLKKYRNVLDEIVKGTQSLHKRKKLLAENVALLTLCIKITRPWVATHLLRRKTSVQKDSI